MKHYLIFLLPILFYSCQQKEIKNNPIPTSDSIVTTKDKEESKPIKEENKQIGDTIFMNTKDEKNLLTAEGVLDSVHSKVYVKFKNETLGELNGKIIPTTGKGNIRFNQIISPNKASDGPFGMDLKIQLKQKGNYILVIGHWLMADNPYYGTFKVELENKKN